MRGSDGNRRRLFAREPKWPPPDPISPDGRLAGLFTIGSVIIAALAWFAVGLNASMCAGLCTSTSDAGALVSAFTAALLVMAIALARGIWIRPVDPEGSTNWRFGLAVIFAIGVAGAATRVSSVTCPPGTHLSVFHYCSGKHDARIPTGEWGWLKNLIDFAGLIVGVTVVASRRHIKVMAPVAGIVFLAGTGWVLLRTLAA